MAVSADAVDVGQTLRKFNHAWRIFRCLPPDHPMDLADAPLVAVAEAERLHKVFTIDRKDFAAYRIKRGHRLHSFDLIGPVVARR